MNQLNNVIPRGGKLQDTHSPGKRDAPVATDQAPLGGQPSYDALLDAAVDYTFPCSDPIAASGCCDKSR